MEKTALVLRIELECCLQSRQTSTLTVEEFQMSAAEAVMAAAKKMAASAAAAAAAVGGAQNIKQTEKVIRPGSKEPAE